LGLAGHVAARAPKGNLSHPPLGGFPSVHHVSIVTTANAGSAACVRQITTIETFF
jgi:hypothetical protein